MMGFYKVFRVANERIEVECPALFGWGNCNTCLLSFEFTYGTANGYEKRFAFTFLSPFGFHLPFVDKFNGHARFSFGCGLFTIFFDWLDKKSILQRNKDD